VPDRGHRPRRAAGPGRGSDRGVNPVGMTESARSPSAFAFGHGKLAAFLLQSPGTSEFDL